MTRSCEQGSAGIVGDHPSILEALELLKTYAPYRSQVLILGETGTGKELFAQALHSYSARRDQPYLPVNLSAIPENLVDGHLFGWEAGAHSQALTAHQGCVERVDVGTLFLDEIGDVPLSIQAKLLRFAETGEVLRLGGVNPVTVDVRIISATNRDLAKDVADGRFREDLLHRLSALIIRLPSLRDRRSDIALLCQHFLDQFRSELKAPSLCISPPAVFALELRLWPGNVRQLRNCLLRAAIRASRESCDGLAEIRPEHLGSEFESLAPSPTTIMPLKEAQTRFTWSYVQYALAQCGNVQGDAAELLGILPSNFSRLLSRLKRDRSK